MPTAALFESVRIDKIQLDETNPRISSYLEHFTQPYTAEQISMALGAGSDDDGGGQMSFNRLKQSIQTNGGVISPVILRKEGKDRYVCIEGNTRVALYKEFLENGIEGNWDVIPAVIHGGLSDQEVHAIRLQAHLVGPRPWTPYAKAKYLTYLRNEEHLEFARLVDFCGGNERSIHEALDAYADMEKHYRPLLEGDEEFDVQRFSSFVELQKAGVKQAVTLAGFNLNQFAQWVIDGKIPKNAQVRALAAVLRDKKATEVFLKSGIEEAVRSVEAPDLGKALQDATLVSLARALTEAIGKIPHRDVKSLKENPGSPAAQYLAEAHDALNDLMADINAE
jgi:hypothetical protein